MSELTRCDYCVLISIRAKAKTNNKRVTILYDADWGMGGANVYVYPKNIDIRKLSGGEKGGRKKYLAAWLMEIPKYCYC